MKQYTLSLIAVLTVFGASLGVAATPVRTPQVGSAIESFSLHDIRGAMWSLNELRDKRVVVIAFLGTECPLVQVYAQRLSKLANDYDSKGVAFVGVNSNQQDSLSEIAHFVKTNEIPFPMLKDAGNEVADRLGAQRTPEVFVLDEQRRLSYHGRIDDQYTYGVHRNKAERQYLVDALDALLAGQPVPTPQTDVVGCHIGRVLQVSGDRSVTFSRDISRILNKRCVDCHRAGQIGPFALTSYAEAVGWAEMIAEVVREQRMPPWHANPEHGQFKNDSRLSDEEKDLISRWVRAGAPGGDPADLPSPPQFVDEWRIGKPDLVVYMSDEPFQVPETGEVKYQHFIVDPGFTEDKWVKAAECRPGNRAVVHHIIVAAGTRERLSGRGGEGLISDWLAATAPGSRPMILAPGQAKRVPAGSKLIFQVHYTPNGKPHEDRSCIGLVFADPSEVQREVVTHKAANPRFLIPAGDPNYRVDAQYTFNEDSLMLALFPHMHLRGKSFRYIANYPDGREEVLLDVPHYDFSWQNSYELQEPKSMPAGTKIQCVAHFDNSADNWANPDPSANVRWGDQTWEEMMIGYFNMTPVKAAVTKSAPVVKRAEQFIERYEKGQTKPDEKLRVLARKAYVAPVEWQAFTSALREVAPQLDRVCWTTLVDGKLSIERAAQEGAFRRLGGAGTSVPAAGLLLAEHVAADGPVVHQNLAEVSAPDFKLMARLFGSSLHIPATLGGRRGVISFWSMDTNGFPPEAVTYLQDVAREIVAGAP